MNTLEIISALKDLHVVPRLAGDDLRLIGETRNLPGELLDQIREKKAELSAFIRAATDHSGYVPIPVVRGQEDYPASNAQRRIWTLCRMEGGAAAYLIVRSFQLKGRVVKENLGKAFQSAIGRHESLRTVFSEAGGELRQVILDSMPFGIEFLDLSQAEDWREYLRQEVRQAASWSFDLERGPLIRVRLYQLSGEEYAMIFGIHHIVSDGWSMAILVRDVMQAYEACCRQQNLRPEPLPIQYKDYCEWHARKLDGGRSRQAQQFWQTEFSAESEPLHLPADFPRPAIRSFEGAVIRFYPGMQQYSAILDLCKESGITLFNFLRGMVSILLSKLSGQQNITIGTPVSGRTHLALENQVGLYVNALPLRTTIDPEESFPDFLRRLSGHSFRVFEFQDYPFDKIVEDLGVDRDMSRNPLFDVMLVLQNAATGEGTVNQSSQYGFELDLLDRVLYPSRERREEWMAVKFDLNFNFDYEPDNTFYLEIEYDTGLFKKERIDRIFHGFLRLIDQVLRQPDVSIRSLDIVHPREKEKILREFNLPVEEVAEHSIFHLLERSFRENADRTALICGDRVLSYKELGDAADSLAAWLAGMYGCFGPPLTGLLMGRTEKILISLLGIWKAGAGYVPIDPAYPSARIGYMMADARLSLLLVDEEGQRRIPEGYPGRVILVDDLLAAQAPGTDRSAGRNDLREQIAYLIYTSGSTGEPKGVEICHRNTIAFLKWACREFAATSFDILYATTSYCFDLSIFEFLFPLLRGKSIRMLRSPAEIGDQIPFDTGIMLNTVPSVVRSLLEQDIDWRRVTALNIAGEPVPSYFKTAFDLSVMEVRNLYGPSEATTYSTVYRLAADDHGGVPIGVPVDYTQLYILDPCQNLQPVGVDGEIYLCGQTIAKGYFGRPDLTATRFSESPFLPGMTMYRTGDTGRWMEDGNVEFIGRCDDQVKIRGYRIEPGEIRSRLEQHEQVEQAAVVVCQINGDNQLVAYIQGPGASPASLKEYLAGQLPAYMIPVQWVLMDRLPLNCNGKLDRKRLPKPEIIQEDAMSKPQTLLQKRLLALWKRVLGTDEIGIRDNFLERGGHSLSAMKLRFLIQTKLSRAITLNELFIYPTVERQASLLETQPVLPGIKIPKVPVSDGYPISLAQERLWVLTKFEAASVAYNMPAVFRVNGRLDACLLEEAFAQVIARHEILRTVFTEKAGLPVQKILPAAEAGFRVQAMPVAGLFLSEALAWLKAKWLEPFDLETGPLLSCYLIDLQEGQLLSFHMHHLIGDAWSLNILYESIRSAYRCLAAGMSPNLPWPEIQYKDFASWHRAQLDGDDIQRHRHFWKDCFSGDIPILELPTTSIRPDLKTYSGDTYRYTFTVPGRGKLRQLMLVADASLFVTVMAAVGVLLKKYAGQDELVIGTPVSGREYSQLEDQIGYYVNTLPIRVKIDPAGSFLLLLRQVKETVFKAIEHQAYSFEVLVEEIGLTRDLSRSPLFDVVVAMEDLDQPDLDPAFAEGVELERLAVPTGIAKYDLLFSFSLRGEELRVSIEYNTDLFGEGFISRMARHLDRLFGLVMQSPEAAIKDIQLADTGEMSLLTAGKDLSKTAFDRSATIVSLFGKVVSRYPDNIALSSERRRLTYRELDELSSRLAGILVRDYGVRTEDLVVLSLGRSECMLIGILGVLKAGAAYVPVEPDYPAARIRYILEDCGSRLVLVDRVPAGETAAIFADRTCLDIAGLDYPGDAIISPVRTSDLAYIIYTSGTTGEPKGVLIEHRQVTRLFFHEGNLFDFGPADRWSLFHSYSFDFSVWEMYGALLYGGTLVIVPKMTTQDSRLFYDFLEKERITVLNQTPTAFRSLLQGAGRHLRPNSGLQVRYLIFGGEALLPGILEPWRKAVPACRIVNMYGITETTVHVTFKEIGEGEIGSNASNIGLPIPTVSCFVLDPDLRQAPVGVTGELCVGGAGVARGYLHKPDLTAEKFIDHPLAAGGKLYRSGDFARILPNGDLEYIGRKDDQVKIRAHRIELADVEMAITHQPYIKDAVVLPVKNDTGESELAAYYIPVEPPGDPVRLRSDLVALLPAYMVPSFLIPLSGFPINSNGKLDKKALPSPIFPPAGQSAHLPARNDIDSQLLEIWVEVLGKEAIGIRDNFFELGGHSLKATRVVARIYELMGIRVDLKTLFIEPTVEHLSNYIETVRWMGDQQEIVADNQDELIV
jgi:amino acid adenylation domain-containing protein